MGKGHPILSRAFATDNQFTSIPIDAIQGHLDDLSGTQAEPGQEQQNAVITLTHLGASVTAMKKRLYLLRFKRFWQTAQPPV